MCHGEQVARSLSRATQLERENEAKLLMGYDVKVQLLNVEPSTLDG